MPAKDALKEIRDQTTSAATQFNEGVTFYTANNFTGAKEKWEKAAAKGHVEAMHKLAEMYVQGKGVVKNYTTAYNLWKQAADKGNAQAMYNLGELAEKGLGTAKSDKEAIYWYKKAAAKGNEQAKTAVLRMEKEEDAWFFP